MRQATARPRSRDGAHRVSGQRSSPASRAPRRVSGPARPARPRPRPVTAPAGPRTVPRRGSTITFERILALPDHRLVDRLLRSRLWIIIVGLLLGGIVAMQVSLLKLNSGISRAVETTTTLERQNGRLEAAIARLGATERVRSTALARGMVLPPAGEVEYLHARPGDPARAVAAMTSPSDEARALLANGGIEPGTLVAATATGVVDPAALGTTVDPAALGTTVDPAALGTTADPAALGTTADVAAPGTSVDPAAPATTVEPAATAIVATADAAATTADPATLADPTADPATLTTTDPAATAAVSPDPAATTTTDPAVADPAASTTVGP